MRRSTAHAAFALALLVMSNTSGTSSARAQEVVHPWQRLGASIEGVYGFPNALFHAGAAASTVPLALWVDEPVQRYFQRHDPLTEELGTVALISGATVPIAVPATLYFGGLIGADDELATAGAAAIQALVMETVVVTTLKWLTDRAGPFPDGDPTKERWNSSVMRDSKSARDFDFNPFDLKWGVRWPSGHTASSFALVSALVSFYPQELWLALVGYPTAFVIGIGMIEGDYHWLSDVVAGALIGHVIGWTVGGEFRATYDAAKLKTPANAHAAPRIRASLTVEPLGLRVIGLL
jgi:membrane-associated phospholipid phosphatase